MVNYIWCKNCGKAIDEFENKCGWCVEKEDGQYAKQVVFPHPMNCTHVYPDGTEEKVKYGQYESILVVSENCWPINRTVSLVVPSFYVTEVLKKDGTRVIFEEPFLTIVEECFGDNSGRQAQRISGN